MNKTQRNKSQPARAKKSSVESICPSPHGRYRTAIEGFCRRVAATALPTPAILDALRQIARRWVPHPSSAWVGKHELKPAPVIQSSTAEPPHHPPSYE